MRSSVPAGPHPRMQPETELSILPLVVMVVTRDTARVPSKDLSQWKSIMTWKTRRRKSRFSSSDAHFTVTATVTVST